MIDIFIELINSVFNSPIAKAIGFTWILWGVYNWWVLHDSKRVDSLKKRIAWLRNDQWAAVYRKALGGLLDKTSNFIGDQKRFSTQPAQPNGWIHRWFGLNPWSPQSYEFSLKLALIYPILFLLAVWFFTDQGQFGDISFSSEGGLKIWQRGLFLVALVLIFLFSRWLFQQSTKRKLWGVFALYSLLAILMWLNEKNWKESIELSASLFFFFGLLPYAGGWLGAFLLLRSAKQAHKESLNIALIFAVAVVGGVVVTATAVGAAIAVGAATAVIAVSVGAVAGGAISAVAAAVVAAAIGATVATGTIASATVTAPALITVAISASLVMTIFILQQRIAQSTQKICWFWFFYSMGIVSLLLFFFSSTAEMMSKNEAIDAGIFLLFFLLLPILNAVLDWLSLGITRGLLQAVRSRYHSDYTALLWVALDLFIAVVLLFAISIVMVFAIALVNKVASPNLVFDLYETFKGIQHSIETSIPAPQYYWIYAMFLSTLIPTFLHFAIAGGATALWFPKQWRQRLVKGWEKDNDKIVGIWFYLTFVPVIGFLVVPGALLYGLYLIVTSMDASRLIWMLDLLEAISISIDPLENHFYFN